MRSVAEVWLGQVRVHQGRSDEALECIEHALIDPDHMAHPFAPHHGRFARVLALGQLGRVGDAFRACDDFRAAIQRTGAAGSRFTAVEHNARAWLLRGVGRYGEADELNRAAVECNGSPDGSGPRSETLAEAYWVAWLDLADGRLACGDPDGAATLLATLAALDTWAGTMAWHQRHRLGLVRARVSRARGNDEAAAELAHEVATDASLRGTERYAALAHVQIALARADDDRARVTASVDVLRRCGALELPNLLEELGRRFDDREWRREAQDRRAALSSGQE